MTTNHLAAMTWRDAATAFSRASLAILPLGSVEQHGPHLALETDSTVGRSVDPLPEPVGGRR